MYSVANIKDMEQAKITLSDVAQNWVLKNQLQTVQENTPYRI